MRTLSTVECATAALIGRALALRPLAFVTVQVNGVEVEALLDSGAARTQLRNRPGLIVSGCSAPGSAGASGNLMSSTRTSSVSLRLGNAEVGIVEVDVVRTDFPGHGDLIGQDVLARYRCTYRLADGVLALDAEAPTETRSMHLDDRRHVYFDVVWDEIDGVASAVFDTGASVTVVDQGFVHRHPRLFTAAGTSAGMDATGRSVSTPMAIMRGPRILDQTLTDALIAVVDLSRANSTVGRPMDLILGWTVLSQAAWYIDHHAARAACLPLP